MQFINAVVLSHSKIFSPYFTLIYFSGTTQALLGSSVAEIGVV